MTLKFIPATEIHPEFTSWFFYGVTRSGKTHATSTFPKRILVLQPKGENSKTTLAGIEGIDVAEVGSTTDTDEVLSHLEDCYVKAFPLWQRGDEASLAKAEEHFPWRTVSFESVNHYTDLLQEEMTQGNKFDMDQQKWGRVAAHLRNVHTRLKALPVHMVFVDLVNRVFNAKQVMIEAKPMMASKQSQKLPGMCDSLVYFEVREASPRNVYTAHFQTFQGHQAGSRYRELKSISKLTPFNFAEAAKLLGIDP